MDNKIKIVFCLSYLSVPLTLSVVDGKDQHFIIITCQPTIYQLFCELYGVEQVWMVNLPKMSMRNPILWIKDGTTIYQLKKHFKQKMISIENNNVYFFFTAFGYFESWMINFLSKKNKVFYTPDVDMTAFVPDETITTWIKSCIYRWIYNVPFETRRIRNRYVFAVSQRFLNNIDANKLSIKTNVALMRDKLKFIYNLDHRKILVLAGNSVVNDGQVSRDEYIKKMDQLIEVLLQRYSSHEIAIKGHPRFCEYFSKETELEKIPSFLPGNLINQFFDVIIGYGSSLLYESANSGKKAISTIDYLIPSQQQTRIDQKQYLASNLQSNATIWYFRTIDELKAILTYV
jgi:hypothetical protein